MAIGMLFLGQLRLRQAMSEQNVIIVIRLLFVHAAMKRKKI
jgi:hypothetical protein